MAKETKEELKTKSNIFALVSDIVDVEESMFFNAKLYVFKWNAFYFEIKKPAFKNILITNLIKS